jgi:small subunit ribosomal protein S6
MSTEYKRVRDYELMVVFHPELSEEDLAAESAKVEGHITGVDGTMRLVNREAPWGRRRLAYPIRHGSRDVRDGVYVLYYFTSESGKLTDVEREIKLQDRILRYLLTQQSAPIMEPAPAEGEETEAASETEPVEATSEPAPVAASEETAAAPVEPAVADEPVVEAPAETAELVATDVNGSEQAVAAETAEVGETVEEPVPSETTTEETPA